MDIFEKEQKYFLNVYKRFPLDIDKGDGVYLYDKSGKKYLDFLSGIAVNALGYNHPAILEAIKRQLNRNLHLSNYFIQDIQIDLAERLLSLTPFSKVFFSNSGTEAIEGLLKLVKKWGHSNNKNEIIAFEGSFHGRSLGALSITLQEKYQKNFQPLLSGIKLVRFNDVKSFEETINERTAAVFFEGIAGEGGVKPLSKEIVKAMTIGREKYGYLLIADEIQTGVGRTGKFYYHEYLEFIPDAIATAKGLGGGLPLGAFLVNQKLENVFDKGEHGTTYGGNPLACAAGLAAVNTVSKESFLRDVRENGQYFMECLNNLMSEFSDYLRDVRGRGLMLGLEVKGDAEEIMKESIGQGLIFNVAGGKTLRFVPPLIVQKSDIDTACQILQDVFRKIFKQKTHI
ncbi:MAG: aspartate aminotransferase family protein [Calditrichaceae bacterium]